MKFVLFCSAIAVVALCFATSIPQAAAGWICSGGQCVRVDDNAASYSTPVLAPMLAPAALYAAPPVTYATSPTYAAGPSYSACGGSGGYSTAPVGYSSCGGSGGYSTGYASCGGGYSAPPPRSRGIGFGIDFGFRGW